MPLHRLPAHDQQRLLARLRATGRGLPPGSRRTEGSPAYDRQRPRLDPLGVPGVRRVGLHCTAARLDGAQRAGRHPGRHLLAAADRAHLDPQQAALYTRGWSELRDAASRRPLVGFRHSDRVNLFVQCASQAALVARCAYLVGLAGLALVLGAPRVLPNRRAAIRGRLAVPDGACHPTGTAGSSCSRTVMKAKRGYAWAASGYRTWGCLPAGVDIVVLQGRLPDPVAR
jgi:hypothetical protein